MIIDIHAHVWDDIITQQDRAKQAGIDTSVLLSTRFHPESCTGLPELKREFGRLLGGLDGQPEAGDPFVASMQELDQALTARPSDTIGFANASLTHQAESVEALAARLQDQRIVGIGELTPAGGHAIDIEPFLQLAADHGGLPVLAHGYAPNTEQDIRTYAQLAHRYPTVPLIVGAFGGQSAMTLIELAQDRPNLYLDTSSALQVFMVRAAAHAVPEQCLYGSNSPYGDPVAARCTLEAAIEDTVVLERVLGLNAATILGM